MPNKTYLGSIYKVKQADGEGWNFHLFATHADAVIEGDNKKFVSQDELSFIQTLIGGGGTGDTAYNELVDKANTNEGNITGLQDDVNAINVLIGADEDGIVNKLEEIINFIEQSAIEEGMSIEDFVESLRADLKINNVEIGSETVKNIYAPTSPGTTDQILVSTGNKPEFKTVKNVITKETTPTPADYGRTNFQGGEIWIDTGSGVLPDPIGTYTMKLKFSEINSGLMKMFLESSGLLVGAPADYDMIEHDETIMIFNTNEGVKELRLRSYWGAYYQGGLPEFHGQIYEFVLGDAEKDIIILPDNVLRFFRHTIDWEEGTPEPWEWSNFMIVGASTMMVPGGQILVDNRAIYKDFPSGFDIEVVPS